MKTRRHLFAAIDPATLTALAVAALVVAFAAPTSSTPGKKRFWEFWKKNPVAQVEKAAAAVDQAKKEAAIAEEAFTVKVDLQRDRQLHIGQEAAIATGAALDAAAAETFAGKLPVRQIETAQTLNRTNVEAMEQALGAPAPGRVRELETMVANLNAGVAAGAKALELLQGTLDRTVQEKAAALAELELVKAEGKAKVESAERERDAAVKKEQTWALQRDGIARSYERLQFWGKIGGAAALAGALFLVVRLRVLDNFGADAVGLVERLKGEIRKRAPAPDYEALKDEMRAEWMTPGDGTAALVDKYKARLRI